MRSLAVYTVVYPAALRFLPEFWRGLEPQLASGFALYLSLDQVSEQQVRAVLGNDTPIHRLEVAAGATPAEVRSRALAEIVGRHDGVILLDSDDVPLPGRLSASREALERHDVYGAALEIVDERGEPVDAELFTLAERERQELEAGTLLARVNAFGFSNTSYRSEVLAACIDAPPETVLLDWLVASRAHLAGATFTFDAEPRMRYRQYGSNTASVLAPFTPERLLSDAGRVVDHFRLLLDAPHADRGDVRPFALARARATEFAAWLEDRANLSAYAERLNSRPPRTYLWWEHVAPSPTGRPGEPKSPEAATEWSLP